MTGICAKLCINYVCIIMMLRVKSYLHQLAVYLLFIITTELLVSQILVPGFKLVDFSIILYGEIHACGINGLIMVYGYFGNLYEICQTAELTSLPNKPCIMYR